ncbi:MAG: hypothetical protein ABI369_09635 [Acetobacteraceae bacterium]
MSTASAIVGGPGAEELLEQEELHRRHRRRLAVLGLVEHLIGVGADEIRRVRRPAFGHHHDDGECLEEPDQRVDQVHRDRRTQLRQHDRDDPWRWLYDQSFGAINAFLKLVGLPGFGGRGSL